MKQSQLLQQQQRDGLTVRLKELNSCVANDQIRVLYKEPKDFLEAFSVKRQREVVNDHRGCIFGAYPTLRQVNTVYGDDVAQDWLIEQVTQLSAYFGVREKLDDMQVLELCDHIYMDFSWLKVSDLMLFFWFAKGGRFGDFRYQIDPIRIIGWLWDFVNGYRQQVIRQTMEEVTSRYEKWYRDNAVKDRDLNKELTAILESRDKENCQRKGKADAEVLESALALVRNTNGYGEDGLAKMCKAWARRYGCTPQNYVSNFNNKED